MTMNIDGTELDKGDNWERVGDGIKARI